MTLRLPRRQAGGGSGSGGGGSGSSSRGARAAGGQQGGGTGEAAGGRRALRSPVGQGLAAGPREPGSATAAGPHGGRRGRPGGKRPQNGATELPTQQGPRFSFSDFKKIAGKFSYLDTIFFCVQISTKNQTDTLYWFQTKKREALGIFFLQSIFFS